MIRGTRNFGIIHEPEETMASLRLLIRQARATGLTDDEFREYFQSEMDRRCYTDEERRIATDFFDRVLRDTR